MAIDGKTLGLALSGGGSRATLFGLGSLRRLNDAGAPFSVDESPAEDNVIQLGRVSDILIDQTPALSPTAGLPVPEAALT